MMNIGVIKTLFLGVCYKHSLVEFTAMLVRQNHGDVNFRVP